MTRAKRVTEALQTHDRELYCARNSEGTLCILRHGKRVQSYDIDGDVIHFVIDAPQFVMALTDNWKTNGIPVEWGTIPILNRIKAHDMWQRPEMVEDYISAYEKRSKADEKDMQNSMESFFLENRKKFQNAFKDVNTSGLAKKDRRYLDDKNMKLKGV